MSFGFIDALTLLGALGFFIYGMKIMSDGIQKAAGDNMRKILGAMTKNRYLGVLTGFFITCLLQSSSATTVMTVSFVNAGLMTLVESAGVMMGANVGTTITAWLVATLGFKVKISSFALPVLGVGFPLIFFKRGKTKHWGEFLIGFSILFMGLAALKDTVPDIKNNPEVLAFVAEYSDLGILSSLLFVAIGALLTVIVQSSSASMTLTITMCYQGWIPFEVAAPMVLGENIGTTITAELASTIANVHAKRSARIHSMFNVIGVTWMIFAYPLYLKGIDHIMVSSGQVSPFLATEAGNHSIPTALAYFHTAFNVSNVFIMIWFVPLLVKLAIRSVPSKGEEDEQFNLEYIGRGIVETPEISLTQVQKEVTQFAKVDVLGIDAIHELVNETEKARQTELLKKIEQYESTTDRLELEVGEFLTKLSEADLTESSSDRVQALLSAVNHLEEIGDVFFRMSRSISNKIDKRIWFDQKQRDDLTEMYNLVQKAVNQMLLNIDLPKDEIDIELVTEIENELNSLRDKLRVKHFKRIEKGKIKLEAGLIFMDLLSGYEKIGDSVFHVSEALAHVNVE